MYIDYSTWESFEYKIGSLVLDPNNPRLNISGNISQFKIIEFLIHKYKVYELAKKIAEEGYFIGNDPLICIENDKKIVLEGNRRVAALKVLQDPKKYLSTAKANTLLKAIAKNEFPVDRKVNCYIAPNRLLANPIIYDRHNGETLERWKTGNQYAFVAKMYYEDGLSIEDICDVLNEPKSEILKPLKAYNLFHEGKDVLEKETDMELDVATFDFTNLERFYGYAPARNLLGIDFDQQTAELKKYLPEKEFKSRIVAVFNRLIDAERFSRDFDKTHDKEKYLNELVKDPAFNMTVKPNKEFTTAKLAGERANLEAAKGKVTVRKKGKGPGFENYIPKEVNITFNDPYSKLDEVFSELKGLRKDRVNSFAILFRTYLEQVLYYYIQEKQLADAVMGNTRAEKEKENDVRVTALMGYIKAKYRLKANLDKAAFFEKLRMNQKGQGHNDLTLKFMLNYVVNHEISDLGNENQIKILKQYATLVKNDMDFAVHILEHKVDKNANERAWKTLEPLLVLLQNKLQ